MARQKDPRASGGAPLENLESLDLSKLPKLLELSENSHELAELEERRQRLRAELSETEKEIRAFLGRFPEVRGMLAARGAFGGRRLTPSGRRPRGWIRSQVETVLRETDRPLTPAEIRDRVAERHPEEATKNLYLAIFQHLRRHDEFEQGEDGAWSWVGGS